MNLRERAESLRNRALLWLLNKYKVRNAVLYIHYVDDRPAWMVQVGLFEEPWTRR